MIDPDKLDLKPPDMNAIQIAAHVMTADAFIKRFKYDPLATALIAIELVDKLMPLLAERADIITNRVFSEMIESMDDQ